MQSLYAVHATLSRKLHGTMACAAGLPDLGARISLMGLLIIQIHRPDQLLDVRNLIVGKPILRVQHFVGPRL